MKKIQLFNEDNLEVMKRLPDESIDVICIDPPYLYLKNQKLERPFDELKFFSECKRLLTKNGFIVMFGRGESFYRWNTILSELKFTFKEEIIWDKIESSSPALVLNRTHENVAIFTKNKGILNKSKIPYVESREYDIDGMITDIKRLKSVFKNPNLLNEVEKFFETKKIKGIYSNKKGATLSQECSINKPVVVVSVAQSISVGMNEKSIIKINRNRYERIHPTQKPVRLIERLLALVIPKDKPREKTVVADFFGGSMSCMEAVHNMGMQGIACEIDKEYFHAGKKRIDNLQPKQPELF